MAGHLLIILAASCQQTLANHEVPPTLCMSAAELTGVASLRSTAVRTVEEVPFKLQLPARSTGSCWAIDPMLSETDLLCPLLSCTACSWGQPGQSMPALAVGLEDATKSGSTSSEEAARKGGPLDLEAARGIELAVTPVDRNLEAEEEQEAVDRGGTGLEPVVPALGEDVSPGPHSAQAEAQVETMGCGLGQEPRPSSEPLPNPGQADQHGVGGKLQEFMEIVARPVSPAIVTTAMVPARRNLQNRKPAARAQTGVTSIKPKHSRRIVAQPLSQVRPAKRAEVVLMREVGIVAESKQVTEAARKSYYDFFNTELCDKNVDAVKELFPSLATVFPVVG